MKPYQFLALPDINDRDLWYCEDSRDNSRMADGTMEEMRAMAESLDAEAAATLYAGPLTRYTIPGWYVTINAEEAARLAWIANKRADDIVITEGVTLIHNGNFSIWSDGKILRYISGGPKLQGISEDAERIIYALRASDSGDVHVAGGMLRLAEIARITNRASISRVGRSYFNEGTIEALDVEYKDGTTQTLYIASRGYVDGYDMQIYENTVEADIEI